MAITSTVLYAIVFGFLVSWLPRIAPVILVKYKGLPDIVRRFLNYLPISILFALTFSSYFDIETGNLPSLKLLDVLASLPTFYVAFKTKNLLYAVLTGIVCMALLRLLMA